MYVGNLFIPYLCVDYKPLASVEKGGYCMVSAGRCYGLFTHEVVFLPGFDEHF